MAQREANAEAKRQGLPLPYPNLWDFWDPTKLPEGASPEEIHQRYLEFCKLCPPPPTIHYILYETSSDS
ncbi:hypothetical protein DYH09_28685 [bacterium CPR1]|nr:hypothetical protein [bacterium CPR1]